MALLEFVSEYNPEILKRNEENNDQIDSAVALILRNIKERGDEALIEYEENFDRVDLKDGLYVTEEEIKRATDLVPQSLKDAIDRAYRNIYAFHSAQLPKGELIETEKGVLCSRKIVPIERVGLYVPGGTAPLFSTVLMLSIPAKIAGCKDILLSTPAKNGIIAPPVLYAASLCGVDRILKAGGAQAIGAMAYGTESVVKRDKIFGPGNRYVSLAKKRVQSFCQIDMLAGPSEVMVVVDRASKASFAAADLISQAEHGPDSQAMLLIKAKDEKEAYSVYENVEKELERLIGKMPRDEYIKKSLSSSKAFFRKTDEELSQAINEYAPEHLILSLKDADSILEMVKSAGSVFMGDYSPESAGDYASGTNHTLPTSGFAKSTSGVSVDSFIKKITVQRLTREGLASLGPTIVNLALAEGLEGHAESVRERLSEH